MAELLPKSHFCVLKIFERKEFAKTHKHWTVQDWNKVLWSDESTFEVFCGAKRAYVRRKVGERFNSECVAPTVKHGGGSFMVWGCMSGLGAGHLYRCEGTVNQNKYIDILKNK